MVAKYKRRLCFLDQFVLSAEHSPFMNKVTLNGDRFQAEMVKHVLLLWAINTGRVFICATTYFTFIFMLRILNDKWMTK